MHKTILLVPHAPTLSASSFVSSIGPSPAPSSKKESYCASDVALWDQKDAELCTTPPKLNRFRLFEINLSAQRILLYENGLLRRTFPIAYQAPYGAWFETPTGYFTVGIKREKFMSSIAPVFMEDAVQLYQDFFIHAIPYYEDGTRVTSQFSGGCIRLRDDVAREFYDAVSSYDTIVSYESFDDWELREGFASPVDRASFWVRQRYVSPLKTDLRWHEDKRENYIQHAGVDLAPLPNAHDTRVYAVYAGEVTRIVRNGNGDAGLGNTVIVRHTVGDTTLFSLYGHLSEIERYLREGDRVIAGQPLGVVGSTGYGCSYWHVGEDGCSASGEEDVHLHLEIKDAPVLSSPDPDTCIIAQGEGTKETPCVGYSSHYPDSVGYHDPLGTIFSSYLQ